MTSTDILTENQLRAAQIAEGLSTLAMIIVSDPDLFVPACRYSDLVNLQAFYAGDADELAAIVRGMKAVAGKVDITRGDFTVTATAQVSPAMTIRAFSTRNAVCTERVVEEKTITEMVPDPTYVAPPVPMVEQTRTEKVTVWDCEPIMKARD